MSAVYSTGIFMDSDVYETTQSKALALPQSQIT